MNILKSTQKKLVLPLTFTCFLLDASVERVQASSDFLEQINHLLNAIGPNFKFPKLCEDWKGCMKNAHETGEIFLEASLLTQDHINDLKQFKNLKLRIKNADNETLKKISELNIVVLALEDPKITDSGLAFIKHLPLMALSLDEAKNITDEGLSHITELPLEILSLEDDKGITDSAVKYLEKMKSLKILLIEDTNITQPAVEKLKDSIPGLKISH